MGKAEKTTINKRKTKYLFKIILTAVLIAINIILERFLAYSVWNQSISFGFIAIAFAAIFLGTQYAVAVAALGDIMGAIISPVGPYFFGFTLTNIIYALLIGFFLYKNSTAANITISVVFNKIICSLILNTIWISMLYRGGLDAFLPVFLGRLLGTAINFLIEISSLLIFFSNKSKIRRTLEKNLKKYLI